MRALPFLSISDLSEAPPFTSLFLASMLLLAASGLSAQEKTAPLTTDAWAGKPVMDARHVTGLVHGRLHNAPKLGEQAPEFILSDGATGKALSLLDLRKDKPVVLFFSSYSCTTAHEGCSEMVRLAKRFKNTANFALIYIREAHPRNGFLPPPRGNVYIIDAPASFAERSAAAMRFIRERHVEFPVLIDSMDDTTAVRWGAWPIRVFVVGRSGEVLYAGQQGPWYFHPSKEFQHNLKNAPKGLAHLPGFSNGSLEEFLNNREKLSENP